jgi:hypothetical protein
VEKLRQLAENSGMNLAKLLGNMVLTNPGEVDAGHVPGAFRANSRVEHRSRSGALSGLVFAGCDSGAGAPALYHTIVYRRLYRFPVGKARIPQALPMLAELSRDAWWTDERGQCRPR